MTREPRLKINGPTRAVARATERKFLGLSVSNVQEQKRPIAPGLAALHAESAGTYGCSRGMGYDWDEGLARTVWSIRTRSYSNSGLDIYAGESPQDWDQGDGEAPVLSRSGTCGGRDGRGSVSAPGIFSAGPRQAADLEPLLAAAVPAISPPHAWLACHGSSSIRGQDGTELPLLSRCSHLGSVEPALRRPGHCRGWSRDLQPGADAFWESRHRVPGRLYMWSDA